MLEMSIIVPFFNEEQNLPKLHREIMETFSKQPFKTEVLYINDGSTDNSYQVLHSGINSNKKVQTRILNLACNYGQTAALSAGIDHAKGKVLGFLDADLQNDPKDLITMLHKLGRETDAVVGWRKTRNDSFIRVWGSKLTNLIIISLFNLNLHDLGCSTKVVKRQVLKNISLYSEFHRIFPIVLSLEGLNIKEVEVNHRKRFSGHSKYFLIRPFLIYDLLTLKLLSLYGTKPSGFFGPLGILLCLASLIPFSLTAYDKLFQAVYVHRNPLFIIAVFLFLLGVQFLALGFIAELVIRNSYGVSKKPIYSLKHIT